MSDLIEITLKVICLSIFSRIAEVGGLAKLLEFVNLTLAKSRLHVPPEIVTDLNRSFGNIFPKLRNIVLGITNTLEYNSIPQLKYIEARYADVLEGPSPRCIAGLVYGNKVNIDIMESVLSICDNCMKNLEIVSCSLVLVPSGSTLNSHRSEYCGVMTYIVAIEGSKLTHLHVNNQVITLTTRASAFFDPTSITKLINTSHSTVILLKLEVYRPFDIGLDAVNWSTIQVTSESQELQYTCKMSTIDIVD